MTMEDTEKQRADAEQILDILRTVSHDRATDFDALISELAPEWELDRVPERIFFQAEFGPPNVIRIGLLGTNRLKAHAYAASGIQSAFATPGFKTMNYKERDRLLSPSNEILNRVVPLELQPVLEKRGINVRWEDVLPGRTTKTFIELVRKLSKTQRFVGNDFYEYAFAFILFHELGHLKFEHAARTHENEKVADRFAAEWILDAAIDADNAEAVRLIALYGIAIALLWLTIHNVFFGQKQSTTPQGYDRLFQVLEQVIERDSDEYQTVWTFVANMLYTHMCSAGFEFDPEIDAIHMQGDPRDLVNHLIDRISKRDKKRSRPS